MSAPAAGIKTVKPLSTAPAVMTRINGGGDMPRTRNNNIPRADPIVLDKPWVLDQLRAIDNDPSSRDRVLRMETGFRQRIGIMSQNLPSPDTPFKELSTSPFVLMALSFHNKYKQVIELEKGLIAGKAMSSIETSLGRMVEEITLPVYGWTCVPSAMHTPYSVIDGKHIANGVGEFATLKSGWRCINDDQVSSIAQKTVDNYQTWAHDAGVSKIDFTVGILYGTYKLSNKKDWHILDEAKKKMVERGYTVTESPDHKWHCSFSDGSIELRMRVRIGRDLWSYIGNSEKALVEVNTALVRACVVPDPSAPMVAEHLIEGVDEIASLGPVPEDFNVSILQKSQLEWLFLILSHYCDEFRNQRQIRGAWIIGEERHL